MRAEDSSLICRKGDSGVTREFEAYEVERFRQMGRHLDLMWNVGKVCSASAASLHASGRCHAGVFLQTELNVVTVLGPGV